MAHHDGLAEASRGENSPKWDGSGDPAAVVYSCAVGLGAICAAVLARLLIEQLVDAVVPFVLTFPAVIGATLLGGALAGVIAAAGCQALVLIYVFPYWTRTGGQGPDEIANLVLSTFTLLLTIAAVAAYRRATERLRFRCQDEVTTLSLLVREIDHRTKNNFQIAAGLLLSQAKAARNEQVSQELTLAATRLQAIASVYPKLTIDSTPDSDVSLTEYLSRLCDALRDGVVPESISLEFTGDAITVTASQAISIGLIVNEWVANAVKHAFTDTAGKIQVSWVGDGDGITVEVVDNGKGMAADTPTGLGSKLILGLVRALGGRLDIDAEDGTRRSLRLPPSKPCSSAKQRLSRIIPAVPMKRVGRITNDR